MAVIFEKPKDTGSQQEPVYNAAIQGQHHSPLTAGLSEEQLLAEELLDLDAKIKAAGVAAINKRIAEIKGQLQLIAQENADPKAEFKIVAPSGTVILGKCAETTQVSDMEGLLAYADKKVGHEAIMAVLSVTLGDLKKLLSENEIASFSTKGYGSRVCKVVPNPQR